MWNCFLFNTLLPCHTFCQLALFPPRHPLFPNRTDSYPNWSYRTVSPFKPMSLPYIILHYRSYSSCFQMLNCPPPHHHHRLQFIRFSCFCTVVISINPVSKNTLGFKCLYLPKSFCALNWSAILKSLRLRWIKYLVSSERPPVLLWTDSGLKKNFTISCRPEILRL